MTGELEMAEKFFKSIGRSEENKMELGADQGFEFRLCWKVKDGDDFVVETRKSGKKISFEFKPGPLPEHSWETDIKLETDTDICKQVFGRERSFSDAWKRGQIYSYGYKVKFQSFSWLMRICRIAMGRLEADWKKY